jgi:vancomycin resistance protein YoaR
VLHRGFLVSLALLPSLLAPLTAFSQDQPSVQPTAPPVTDSPATKTPATVSVAGVPVTGGTPPEQIRALLARELAAKLDTPITLMDGERTVTRTRRELGIRLDLDGMIRAAAETDQPYVPLLLTTDPAEMHRALVRIAPEFAAPAVSARPYLFEGRLTIKPSADARTLDVLGTIARLADAVVKDPKTLRFEVALEKTPPGITTEQLAGITGVLASFATTAPDNPNRDNNIEIAVKSIDGTVLAPGDTFSLNDTVGQRTVERGFRTATVFADGKKVDGIGGGVSQVTGTLFNAAALAGLTIREAHPHSRPVAYLPLGRDATVAWEQKDLRFTNDTGAPVYIQYTFRGQRLRAVLFGKKVEDREIALEPRVQRLGPGRITAQLYRTIRENGRPVREERLFRHTYSWNPED